MTPPSQSYLDKLTAAIKALPSVSPPFKPMSLSLNGTYGKFPIIPEWPKDKPYVNKVEFSKEVVVPNPAHHVKIPHLYPGTKLMIADWSDIRSPSRALRRLKRGFPQRIKYVEVAKVLDFKIAEAERKVFGIDET